MKTEMKIEKLAKRYRAVIPRQGSLAYQILMALVCGQKFSSYTADQRDKTPSAGRSMRELAQPKSDGGYGWPLEKAKPTGKRFMEYWL